MTTQHPSIQRMTIWITAGLALSVAPARAQNARVQYDHRPGEMPAVARTRYLLPGERTKEGRDAELHDGPVPLLSVPQGSSACVVVQNANTLLYSYALSQRTVSVESPSGLADLLTGFASAIGAIGSRAGTFGASAIGDTTKESDVSSKAWQDSLSKYASDVKTLADVASALAKTKTDSDLDIDLSRTLESAKSSKARGEAAHERATRLFENSRQAPASLRTIFDIIRSQQTMLWTQVETAFREIEQAATLSAPTFCMPIKEQRVELVLTITARTTLSGERKRARPVDSLSIAVVDPLSLKRFELVPAFAVAFGVSGAQRFSVKDGKIEGTRETGPYVTPGIFALGRAIGPLWGMIGISKGQELADGFIGVVLRGGDSVVGTNLIVGGGLALSSVPTGLKAGAVGQPLPANVQNLTNIVERKHRPGAAIIFTLSGLSLGADKKETK